ncbi:hypothetical protein AHMF7605_25640 [Adhaeribacter arboris]|uniref:Uncharacterized protein n=1 Tax=Adhaeribacter arboris TaxID=2072846 RepID=A0A2T2YMD4_9BACT|nr:hypothetical protein [Adhaeribacter arboris]PSR56635.1 hypothetical protein AHMF7605_25640 [Adhaeribacter arboris]
MIKDIGYLIRSPLFFACIVACIWHGTKSDYFSDSNVLIILSLFILPFISLYIIYIIEKITNKVFTTPSYAGLPGETKYGAVYLFVLTCSLSKSLFSLQNLLIIVCLFFWTNLGSSFLFGALSNSFDRSLKLREASVSLSMLTWFLILATISWVGSGGTGIIIGIFVGIFTIFILPFLVVGMSFLIHRIFLMMGIHLFLIDENYKILGFNPVEEKSNEELRKLFGQNNIEIKAKHRELAFKLIELIDRLSFLSKEMSKQDFDNNKAGLRETIANFRRWKNETEEFIRDEISIKEADYLNSHSIPESYAFNYMDFKIVNEEINQHILPQLKSLTKALSKENFIIMTKSVQHTRYRVLKELYNLAPNDGTDRLLITNLSDRLKDLPFEEINEILKYWKDEKLLEIGSDWVRLTPFGVDEIKDTIIKPHEPTSHFPANIVYDYSVHYDMTVGNVGQGAIIQQGVSNSSATSTVYNNSSVNEASAATTKLLELIKSSPLPELDKDEATINLKRLNELSEQAKTPEVKETAKKRIEIVKGIIEVAKEAGGIAVKAAPYIATLFQFFR